MTRMTNAPIGVFSFSLLAMVAVFSPVSSAETKRPPVVSSAVAMTCLGLVDIDIVGPADGWMRWRAALRLPRGGKFVGYFRQRADKPVKMRKPLAKVYPKAGVTLRQTGQNNFKLRKANAPDCDIEVIKYDIVVPSGAANLYGSLFAPLVLAYDQQTDDNDDTWGATPEKVDAEDSSWVWEALVGSTDSKTEVNEKIAGNNNPWENAEQGGSSSDGDWDEDGDGFHDADTNKDGVVSLGEELSWMSNQVKGWFRQGGVLGWL